MAYLKKGTSNVLKIIALYPCYQFVVRYLKDLYIIIHAIILWVPGISGDLVVNSRLPPQSGSSLEAVEPHP